MRSHHPEDKVKHFHLLLTAVALSNWNNRPETSSQLRQTTCAGEATAKGGQPVHGLQTAHHPPLASPPPWPQPVKTACIL